MIQDDDKRKAPYCRRMNQVAAIGAVVGMFGRVRVGVKKRMKST